MLALSRLRRAAPTMEVCRRHLAWLDLEEEWTLRGLRPHLNVGGSRTLALSRLRGASPTVEVCRRHLAWLDLEEEGTLQMMRPWALELIGRQLKKVVARRRCLYQLGK